MKDIVNMESVKEKIQERVKTSFFELLPDDKFAELVDTEVKAFFESTSEDFRVRKIDDGYYYNKSFFLETPISPFRAIVWAACKESVKERIAPFLREQGFTVDGWDENGKIKLSEKLEHILKDQAQNMAASFFREMFGQMFSQVEMNFQDYVQNVINNMQNGY